MTDENLNQKSWELGEKLLSEITLIGPGTTKEEFVDAVRAAFGKYQEVTKLSFAVESERVVVSWGYTFIPGTFSIGVRFKEGLQNGSKPSIT